MDSNTNCNAAKHPLKSHPKSSNLAGMSGNQTSSSAAQPTKTPLRAHPNVMHFATKPTDSANPSRSAAIRPIGLLPTDMTESEFSRVTFLGDEYWVSADRNGEAGAVEKDEEVVKEGNDEVVVAMAGNGNGNGV